MIKENGSEIWKKFLKKHWKMLVLFIVVAIVLFIGAILIYLWFVEEAQSTGIVPGTLGLWSMGHVITFLLHLIFWEAIIIGIPALIIAVIIWQLWWKRLPDDEKKEYKRGHLFGKRSRRKEGGEGISFLVFLVFLIKIYLDGNWGVPFATWTFDYLVYSCITAFILVVVIIGIPILIGGTWYLRHEMKKEP